MSSMIRMVSGHPFLAFSGVVALDSYSGMHLINLFRNVMSSITNALGLTPQNLGEKVFNGTKEFLNGVGVDLTNLNAQNLGEKVVKGTKDFLSGAGVDPTKNAQDASNLLQDVIKNIDSGKIAKTAAEALNHGFDGFKDTFDLGAKGRSIGEELKKGAKDFLSGAGVDPTKNAQDASNLLQDVIKNINLAKITTAAGEALNDGFDGFKDTIDLGAKGQSIGEEIKNGMNGFTAEIGEGIEQGIYNTIGNAAKALSWSVIPYVVGGIIAVIATPLLIYYGYQKAKHNIGRPQLANEVRQRGILTPIIDKIKSISSVVFGSSNKKPIYNGEVTRRIDDLIQSTQNIRKNGGYFQNVLFYGPGGTGKTMISEYIARNSGMSYVKMSGADLAQYIKRGEHVTELNKLMDKVNGSWRPWSNRPWILFIDEAESLCRDRNKMTETALLELQNAFLNRTGTESKKFMIILATNRMEDLDEAVLSRMDHKIHIAPPAEAERIKIIKSYLSQFFSKAEIVQHFADEKVTAIARETEGFTGRALFKMLNAMSSKKMATRDNKLTAPMIDQTVKDMVEQEKEVLKRRIAKGVISVA